MDVELRLATVTRRVKTALLVAAFALSGCGAEAGAESPLPEPSGSETTANTTGLAALEGQSCAAIAETATSTFRPIDVVFLVDNSGSMSDEIAAVERSINRDFAQIMEASGLDYRVVMVSRYGASGDNVGQSENPICVDPPLSGGGCESSSKAPVNSQRFFHYSANVQSKDGWCVLLGSYDQPDEYGDVARPGWTPLAPNGWREFLRPDAFKIFIAVGDDEVDCRVGSRSFSDHSTASGGEVAAESFDSALLALSPEQFGTARQRNYVWHSIVGMRAYSAASGMWPASAPIETRLCGLGAQAPGTGYQALSRLTHGMRYPSCDSAELDAVFDTVAHGIVGAARIACRWQIPAPPTGERFDRSLVNVRYTPSGNHAPLNVGYVGAASQCRATGGWYYDDAASPRNIVVCPSTCATLQQDPEARVDVLFGCATDAVVR